MLDTPGPVVENLPSRAGTRVSSLTWELEPTGIGALEPRWCLNERKKKKGLRRVKGLTNG